MGGAGNQIGWGIRRWRLWLRLLLVSALAAALVTVVRGPDLGAIEHVAGELDTTFDGDGIAVTEISSDVDVLGSALQVLPDGGQRLLVLEEDTVWRFLPDGTLDTTFDGDGVLVHNVFFSDLAIATGPGGAFAIGGRSGTTMWVTRFNPDGIRDTAFGINGSASVSSPVTQDVDGCPVEHSFLADSGVLAMLADGSTVVVGPGNIGECDVTETDEGLLAVRLGASGSQTAVHGAMVCADASFGTDLADPRSIQELPGGAVAVSTAVQCTAGVDPVTVVRFAPGLAGHEEFDHSGFQPTDGRRLPLVVDDAGGFAVAAESPDSRAWNLLRWNSDGGFEDSTPLDLPSVATGTIGGLDITGEGLLVVSGGVDGRAAPDGIGVGRFDRDGVAVDLDVVSHDDGQTALDVRTTIRLPDGTVRLIGHAAPDVFGLDPNMQLAISRVAVTGLYDITYGGGLGVVQHLGGVFDAGEAVQVRPDLRIVGGGGITGPPEDEREPTGFVLQHVATGPLDPSFSPSDRPGIEITRYAAPTAIPLVFPGGGEGPFPATAGTGTAGALAQTDPPVEVGDETSLRDAFGDPDVLHVLLTADITLTCTGFGYLYRAVDVELLVDGGGHTITQTCAEFRVMYMEGSAPLTLLDVTLTGGQQDPSEGGDGGAVKALGPLTVERVTVEANSASTWGGGLYGEDGITVIDSTFTDNSLEGGDHGGAIASFRGDVIVSGSTFSGNSAGDNGGLGGAIFADGDLSIRDSTFVDGIASHGGAVLAAGHVESVDSHFEDNEAHGEDGGATDGYGGAIHGLTVEVTRSTFVRNIFAQHGGAIWADTRVVATDSTFVENRALGFDSGGAIGSDGDVVVTDSVFLRNLSDVGGAIGAAGDVEVSDSVFEGNIAEHFGGAIHTFGQANVQTSIFTENQAWGAEATGGAIHAATVDVLASTFDGNFASDGGGGAVYADDAARLVNSTLAGNEASGPGSAIVVDPGELALLYVTIVDNEGDSQVVAQSLVSVGSVITESVGGANCGDGTEVVESSYSWSDDVSCDFGGVGDTVNGSNAFLGSLADNGGPTPTARPADFGPLVNAIPTDACTEIGILVDQRGETRPTGPRCDIGAVELFGPYMDIEVQGLALDAVGRSVIAGLSGFGEDGAIHRLLVDGAPDPTFNGGRPLRGATLFGPSVLATDFHDVTIDAAGRIVVVGEATYEFDGFVDDVVVLRLLADGTLDPDFGDGGIVRLGPTDPPTDWDASGRAVTIDGLGRILLTGRSQIAFNDFRDHLLIARLNGDGTPDGSFGSSVELGPGTRIEPSPAEMEQVGNDITTRGDQILVAGTRSSVSSFGGSEPATEVVGFVLRLGPTGASDTTFGPAGYRFPFDPAPVTHSVANALAVDAIGNVVVTGGSLAQASAGSAIFLEPDDLLLARVQPDGTQDPLFGTDGVTITQAPAVTAGEQAHDVSIAPDGKIVVIGSVADERSTRVLTARYSPGLAELQCIAIPTDVGPVLVGEPLTTFIECTAVGGTVIVTGVTLDPTSADPDDFTVAPETCAMARLAAGESCFVSQTFTPTTTGARSMVVNIGHLTVRGPGATLVPVRGSGFVDIPTEPPTEPPTEFGPFLFLTPEEGPIDTEVEASGSVFDPGVPAEVRLGDTVVASVPGAAVGSDGGFTASFTIAPGTPGGPHDVVACQRCGQSDERTATAVFTVTPRLFVSPTLSRPGGVVTATGDGFVPGVPVRLRWNPGLGGAVVLPDDDGEFSTPLIVFRNDRLGVRELEALVSGSDDVAATTPFLAVPGSSQPGDFAIRR